MVEMLVLSNINLHIPLTPTHHGFRPHLSTSTHFTNLTYTNTKGLIQQQPAYRTLTAASDIRKAFDKLLRHLHQLQKNACQISVRPTRIHRIQRQFFPNKALHKRSPTRLRSLTHTPQPLHTRYSISLRPKHAPRVIR